MPVGGSAQSFEERQLWSLEAAGYRCIAWIRGALTWTKSRPWGQVTWLHHDQPDRLTSSVITHTLSSAGVITTAACHHVVCSRKNSIMMLFIYIFKEPHYLFYILRQFLYLFLRLSMKKYRFINVLCVLCVDLDGKRLHTIVLTGANKVEFISFCEIVKISFYSP